MKRGTRLVMCAVALTALTGALAAPVLTPACGPGSRLRPDHQRHQPCFLPGHGDRFRAIRPRSIWGLRLMTCLGRLYKTIDGGSTWAKTGNLGRTGAHGGRPA